MEKNMQIILDKESLSKLYFSLKKLNMFSDIQCKTILTNLYKLLKNEDFFNEYFTKNSSYNFFNERDLFSLVKFVNEKTNDINITKNIIINSPLILVFSNNIDDIYFLYKGNSFEGYVLLQGKDFKAYRYIENENVHIQKATVECNYLIKNILNDLNREDIKESLKIDGKESMKDKMNALNSGVKRYFFKK